MPLINSFTSKFLEFIEKAKDVYLPQYFGWLENKVADAGDFTVLSYFIGLFPLVVLMLYLLFRNRY